jgi:hypothetical protein
MWDNAGWIPNPLSSPSAIPIENPAMYVIRRDNKDWTIVDSGRKVLLK